MKPTNIPIKRQTIMSSVTDLIRSRIISGEYPGGFPIRQELIAEECDISRIPVREALVQLESEGLIVIHTHRGAVVATLDEQDAVDIFEARLLLEPYLIALAMKNATKLDCANVQKALANYQDALAQDAEPAQLSVLNWEFHKALTQPAGRPRSLAILQTLYHGADRYLRLQIDESTAQIRALDDHKALTDAFTTGQVATAKALLKQHIANARRDVVKSVRLRSAPAKRKKKPSL